MAQAAEEEFLNVLGRDPNNVSVMARLAKLYYDQKKLDQSWQWYKKLVSVDPNYKDAHYTLGVIAWNKTFPPRMDARARLGMKSDDPGPLKDKKTLAELRAQSLPVIQEGMQHLEKALAIQADYDDAMSYLNLLYRERADLAQSAEEYKQDTATADDWIDKTLQTRKAKQIKAAAKTSGGLTTSQ
jgi:Tfp pilus assembly protein PilF